VNSNDTVTLTGTAPGGSTVAVSDGGTIALGTTTASSSGAWSFTTADLSAASYAFTATDATSAGTSTASSPVDLTVPDPPPPVILSDTVNANGTVTLTGTAEADSTVTVYDGTTELGTTTANAGGAWSYITPILPPGSQVFTATATVAGNTSALSKAIDPSIPLDPTIVTQQPGSAPADIGNNTVLQIDIPDSGSVAFTGTKGILCLEQPSTFTGNVFGFRAQNGIDLPGITFDAQTTLGYSPNSNGTAGTLAITDGTHSAKIALLGNYIASSFVMGSDNHGGTILLTTAAESGNQSLLTHPQH
jgi:hypothetical protein